MPKIKIEQLNLSGTEEYEDEMDGALRENGPWKVQVWNSVSFAAQPKVVLQSEDFMHDVALVIDGDFKNHAQKIRYAERLADRMNRMPKE